MVSLMFDELDVIARNCSVESIVENLELDELAVNICFLLRNVTDHRIVLLAMAWGRSG